MRRNASMIGTCVTFLHRRTLRTCFGVSKLTSSRRSSFSSLLALQREFRKLHSADGSKHSALITFATANAFVEGDSSHTGLALPASAGERCSAHISHPCFPYRFLINYTVEIHLSRNLVHVRLNSILNNDFVQKLHLNRAGGAIENRIFAFRFIRSIARVARVCHAFVAVTNSCCDHLAV